MKPHAILETCLYVDDLDAARQFYGDLIGLEFVSQREGRHVFFRCGDGMLLLFNPEQSGDPQGDLPPHSGQTAGHIAFAVKQNELDGWRSRVTEAGVAIEQTVEWPQGGQSLYFRDPSGNSVELATPRIWGLVEKK